MENAPFSRLKCLASALLLTAAAGPCSDDGPANSMPPTVHFEKNDSLVATQFIAEKTPELLFPLDSMRLTEPPEWVEFEVVELENPREVPFVVSLFLEKTGKPGPDYRLPLGFFALYPPDEPARPRLRFDRTARQLRKICGARDTTHQFQIRLVAEPNDSSLGLSGLRVQVVGPHFGN